MKKIFLLAFFSFFLSLNSIAQTKLPNIKSQKFNWEEKEQNKTFEVAFKYFLDDIIIPQERLNSLIMNAIIQSKYKLKNKLSFSPIEVNIYNSENNLTIFVKYGGKNSYGVESLSQSYYTFKNEEDLKLEHLLTN